MANQHNSMFNHAIINEISGGNFQIGPTAEDVARDLLAKHIAPNALPDSDAMYDGPKCYPETRKAIHKKLERWIRQRDDVDTRFIWLQGGAGAGKSAIMRTIAMGGSTKQDDYSENPRVLGSFFFSRQDSTRNTVRTLVPTLALQLCYAHPAAWDIVLQAVAEKRELIFMTSLRNQVFSLLVRPLAHLKREYNWLSGVDRVQNMSQAGRVFIIDGLDECSDHKKQREVIEALAILVKELPVRVRLASRPDEPILSAIRRSPILRSIYTEVCLSDDPDSDKDIRLFLEQSLRQVGEHYRSQPYTELPEDWPEQEDMEELVGKSSQHFIYASTAEKYIASGHEHPDVALGVILGSQPPRTGQPFERLDALCRYILGKARFQKEALEILSFIVFWQAYNDIDHISYSLGYPPADIALFLSDMHALVIIDISNRVRFQHKSFAEFLQDKTRAQDFYIGTEHQFHKSP